MDRFPVKYILVPERKTQPLLSVIAPVHNEEEGIAHFYNAIKKVLAELPYDFELILVEDGSRDNSIAEIQKLRNYKNVRLAPIYFARNFGKEIATTAGLHHAKGEAAIMIDSDLQHPVELIPELIAHWEKGANVVVGVRRETKSDSIIKRVGSKYFYQIMNRISETKLIPHATDYRLVDRKVIDDFSNFSERNRITRGLIDWLGYDCEKEIVEFDANEREYGTATYRLSGLIKLAVASFTAHSLFPLRIVGYLGAVLVLLAGSIGLFVLIEQVIMGDPMGLAVSGTAMITLMLVFICGVIMISLGVLSIYLGYMHTESLNRPLYVVRELDKSNRKPRVSRKK